jgi:hypothetical protein
MKHKYNLTTISTVAPEFDLEAQIKHESVPDFVPSVP